jgi:hypothetical protein
MEDKIDKLRTEMLFDDGCCHNIKVS